MELVRCNQADKCIEKCSCKEWHKKHVGTGVKCNVFKSTKCVPEGVEYRPRKGYRREVIHAIDSYDGKWR